MNLSSHARLQAQRQANEILGRTIHTLGPLHRRVLSALLTRTTEGWRLFVRRESADSDAGKAHAFLIGPRGVFAISIVETALDDQDAQTIIRHAGERFAGIRAPQGQVLPASAVDHVVVVPVEADEVPSHSRLYRWLTERELPRLFEHGPTRLNRRQIDSITNQFAKRIPEYLHLRVQLDRRGPETTELFDSGNLTADQLITAQQRTFESWLTFLHPHQQVLVTRDYGGPARISGPAGTGKTVVALHRLRYLARRSIGPLLFTTLVRTLPHVHQQSFKRLAPELGDRVEFIHLHAWIRDFLRSQGKEVVVQPRQVNNASVVPGSYIGHRYRNWNRHLATGRPK